MVLAAGGTATVTTTRCGAAGGAVVTVGAAAVCCGAELSQAEERAMHANVTTKRVFMAGILDQNASPHPNPLSQAGEGAIDGAPS